jgi:hypothetical protein
MFAILFVAGCGSTPAKPTVGVAMSPAGPVTLEQGGTAALTAAVTNDTASAGVTWTLTGAGSLTGNTVTAVTYNAPASITAASSATVKATSVADTTKSASFTVNLVLPPAVAPGRQCWHSLQSNSIRNWWRGPVYFEHHRNADNRSDFHRRGNVRYHLRYSHNRCHLRLRGKCEGFRKSSSNRKYALQRADRCPVTFERYHDFSAQRCV